MFALETVREASLWVGVLAAFLLVYRLFDWPDLTDLERGANAVLLLVLVGQAYGSTRSIQSGGATPDADVVWTIFACRVAVVLYCLAWPRLRRSIFP